MKGEFLRPLPAGITVRLSAEDEAFSILINHANGATAPAIRRLRKFVRVNPMLDAARTVCRWTTEMRRLTRSCAINDFNLATADEFVTATTKPSVIE
jgi:hypothetical protein